MLERKTQDLVEHLRLLVHEEAPLWEVPLGTTIVTDKELIHAGPWSAQRCASVLLRWIAVELVVLYRSGTGSAVELSRDEALALVEDARQWPDQRDVFLSATARGGAVADHVWREVAGPVG